MSAGTAQSKCGCPTFGSARFAAEAHREALALAEADRRSDDMDFVEAISDLADDE